MTDGTGSTRARRVAADEEPGAEACARGPRVLGRPGGRLARSTALFSLATSLSRITGLVRKIFAASCFGLSGAMSAFSGSRPQVPNLVRRPVHGRGDPRRRFLPIFTEQLARGDKREAFRWLRP